MKLRVRAKGSSAWSTTRAPGTGETPSESSTRPPTVPRAVSRMRTSRVSPFKEIVTEALPPRPVTGLAASKVCVSSGTSTKEKRPCASVGAKANVPSRTLAPATGVIPSLSRNWPLIVPVEERVTTAWAVPLRVRCAPALPATRVSPMVALAEMPYGPSKTLAKDRRPLASAVPSRFSGGNAPREILTAAPGAGVPSALRTTTSSCPRPSKVRETRLSCAGRTTTPVWARPPVDASKAVTV